MNGRKVKRGALGLAYDYYASRERAATFQPTLRPYFVSPKGCPVNYVYVYRYGETAPTVFPTEEAAIAWMDWMFMLEEDKLLKEGQKP